MLLSHIGPVVTVNDSLTIEPGEPGAGGAPVSYLIADKVGGNADHKIKLALEFQNGMPEAVGVNGITNEVLTAILIDRMQGFQAGPYKCVENQQALTAFQEALQWMKRRAKNRESTKPKEGEKPSA